MRILIPSAGAASSISVIKEAKKRGHWVLATDMRRHAAGMHLADACFTSSVCYEEEYVPSLIDACLRHSVEYVIPINSAELPIYAEKAAEFREAGIRVLQNPPECIKDGHDKLRSWHVCEAFGIRQPERYFRETNIFSDFSEFLPGPNCFPMIAKPPCGAGGRGQVVCRDINDLAHLVRAHADDMFGLHRYIWQRYIEYGTEYTVDCWGDPAGEQFVAVPRTRLRVVNGQATEGVVVDEQEVIDMARAVCLAFGSNNVCCVQLMRDHGDGELYFIEFNPRYGTGVSLSFAAGVDFLLLQEKQANGEDIPTELLQFRPGVGMSRHWQELFYTVDDD